MPLTPQEQAQLDKYYTKPKHPKVATMSEAGKGARAFVDETQALGGGAVALGAQALQAVVPDTIEPQGIEDVRQWGMDTYKENMKEAEQYVPNVAKIEDINFSDEGGMGRLVDWAAFQGTKGLGTVATIAAGGGVGGMLAKQAVKGGVRRMARGAATKQIKEDLMTELRKPGKATTNLLKKAKTDELAAQAVVRKAANRGMKTGATAGAFGMEGGESYGQLEQEVGGEAALLPSLAVGAINAALELTPWGIAAKYLNLGKLAPMEGIKEAIKKSPTLSRRVVQIAKGAAAGMSTEGVTEAMQELVQIGGERWAKNEDLMGQLSADQRSQVMNAAAAGMLVGGGIGGAVGPMKGKMEEERAGEAARELVIQEEKQVAREQAQMDKLLALKQQNATEATEEAIRRQGQRLVEAEQRATLAREQVARAEAVDADILRREQEVGTPIQPGETLEEGQRRVAALRTAELRQREIDKYSPIEGEQGEITEPVPPARKLDDGVLRPLPRVANQGIEVEDLGPIEPTGVEGELQRAEVPEGITVDEVAPSEIEDIVLVGDETIDPLISRTERAVQDGLRKAEQEDLRAEQALSAPEQISAAAKQAWDRSEGELQTRAKLLGSRNAQLTRAKWDELNPSQQGRVLERIAQTPELKRVLARSQEQEVSGLASQETQVQKPATLSQVREQLAASPGLSTEWVAKAESDGFLQIHEGTYPGKPEVNGIWDGETIHLYTGAPGTANLSEAILLHEGTHARLGTMLDLSLNKYAEEVENLAVNDRSKAAVRARVAAVKAMLGSFPKLTTKQQDAMSREEQRAYKAQRVTLYRVELVAYYVQFARESGAGGGLYRRILNSIKAWFAQTDFGQALKRRGLGIKLTDDMAVAMARRAVKEDYGIGGLTDEAGNVLESDVWHSGPNAWQPEPGFPYGRPRLDKVGTGEGGQLFGWGFYTAENEEVSGPDSNYSRAFDYEAKVQLLYNGQAVIPNSPQETAIRVLDDTRGKNKIAAAKDELQGELEQAERGKSSHPVSFWKQSIQEADKLDPAKITKKAKASTYHLEIPDADIERMIQWEKPLSEQTEEVQRALEKLDQLFPKTIGTFYYKANEDGTYDLKGTNSGFTVIDQTGVLEKDLVTLVSEFTARQMEQKRGSQPFKGGWRELGTAEALAPIDQNITGQRIYERLERTLPRVPGEHPKKKVSEYLRSLGIVGNKYLDWGSRKEGEGTYNYVIWDQDVLDRVAHLNPETGEKLSQQNAKGALFSEVTTNYTEGLSELVRKSGQDFAEVAKRLETASRHPATKRLAHERGALHFMLQQDVKDDGPLSDLVDGFYDPETKTFLSREDAKQIAQAAYGTTRDPRSETELESQELRRAQNEAKTPREETPMVSPADLPLSVVKQFEKLGMQVPEGLASVGTLGYYSPTAQALEGVKQARGTGEQMHKMLSGKRGVKEEMEAIGLDVWLKGKGRVSKDEIREFVEQGGVQLEERVKGDGAYVFGPDTHPKLSEPGGENYRELLLTLPPQDKEKFSKQLAAATTPKEVAEAEAALTRASDEFQSTHYEEPNILAHIRFNERVDLEGNKVLFVEEVQSDWHQKGKKEGYAQDLTEKEQQEKVRLEDKTVAYMEEQFNLYPNPRIVDLTTEESARLKALREKSEGPPDAPFKKSWPLLAMKQAIRWAGENGFDKVAWTPGIIQVNRYSEELRQQVERFRWTEQDEVGDRLVQAEDKLGVFVLTTSVDPDGKLRSGPLAGKQLEKVIGKNAANKILTSNTAGTLTGDQLTIGGEGMKSFYDRELPNTLNKYLKQQRWGRVGTSEINSVGEVWSIDVSPGMREQIANKGQPLFSTGTLGYYSPTAQALRDSTHKRLNAQNWLAINPKYTGPLSQEERETLGRLNKEYSANRKTQKGGQEPLPLAEAKRRTELQTKNKQRKYSGVLAQAPGFKEEEVEELGLIAWLDTKGKGRVSKDEIREFVEQGGVQLEERVLGPDLFQEQRRRHLEEQAQDIDTDRRILNEQFGSREDPDFGSYGLYDLSLESGQVVFAETGQRLIPITTEDRAIVEKAEELRAEALEFEELRRAPTVPSETPFADYQEPGGENYRELLLTLPAKKPTYEEWVKQDYGVHPLDLSEFDAADALMRYDVNVGDEPQGAFRSTHYKEPNILAHIRFNERVDAEGKKVLFVEEVQSDWHQKGRTKGYSRAELTGDAIPQDWTIQFEEKFGLDKKDIWTVRDEKGVLKALNSSREQAIKTTQLNEKILNEDRVPDAPFKKSWPLLAMKRAIRWASENGFDKVAWKGDPQQLKSSGGWASLEQRGEQWFANGDQNVTAVVNRYMEDIPRAMAKYLKQQRWGRVETSKIDPIGEVWSIDVSPGMREQIANKGQPLFSLDQPISMDKTWLHGNERVLGVLDKAELDYIDQYAGLKTIAPDIVSEFDLAETKAGAKLSAIKNQYVSDLEQYMGRHKMDVEQTGLMYAARHVVEDDQNRKLSERHSDAFVNKLVNAWRALGEDKQANRLAKRQKDTRELKKTDKDGKETGVLYKEEHRLQEMHRLMDEEMTEAAKLRPTDMRDLQMDWESFKDHASGLSTGSKFPGASVGTTSAIDLYKKGQTSETFKHVAAQLDIINRMALDVRLEGGLITQKEYDKMLEDKKYYAPLRRAAFDYTTMIGRGYGAGKGLQTRVGSVAANQIPVHVIQNSLAKLDASIQAAEQNKARNLMAKTVAANPKIWNGWFTVEKGESKPYMDKYGFTRMTEHSLPSEKDISFVKDGKRLLLKPAEGNERAMSFVIAVNKLDANEMQGPLKAMSWVNRWIRAVNITVSPAFMVANMIRDPLTAAYNLSATDADGYTKAIFKEYGSSFRALRKTIHGKARETLGTALADPDAEKVVRWENAGGRISMTQMFQEMDTSLLGSFEGHVRMNKFTAARRGKQAMDYIENLNMVVENTMRLSAFTVLTRPKTEGGAGMSDSKAARISKDMTTNFTRKGLKAQTMSTWWLFFNATKEGNRQVWENLAKGKNKAKLQKLVAGTMVFSFLVDALGRAVGEDDEDGDGLNDWDYGISASDKERNIYFPVRVNGTWLKIPAPWVYNVVWRAGQMTGEVVAGVDGKDAPGTALDMLRMTSTALNPMAGGTLLQTLSPTSFDPAAQIIENKSWTGFDLSPTRFPGDTKPASQMAWASVPQGYKDVARAVSDWTGGTPAEGGTIDWKPSTYKIMHDTIWGGAGRFLEQLYGVAADEETELKDFPLARQFATTPKDYLTTQLFYDRTAQVKRAVKSLAAYSRGPDRDTLKARELRKDRRGELSLDALMKDTERQIKSLRVRKRAAAQRMDEKGKKRAEDGIKKAQQRFNEAWARRVGS